MTRKLIAMFIMIIITLAVLAAFRTSEARNEKRNIDGQVEILQSWQGDFPVAQLETLPEAQRNGAVGFIDDAETFENVWKAIKPDEEVPYVDFKANLVLFARNTRYYDSTRIGRVILKEGVAEVLIMETMSALPIEDKAAMSLAVVPRQGISAIQAGDEVIPIREFR